MRFSRFIIVAVALCLRIASPAFADDYAVVVSTKTWEDADWRGVVRELISKHDAQVLKYETDPADVLEELRHKHPRYTCFVATRAEATREFVAAIHQMTRRLDDDPYADTLWGILTGFDAGNALDIASCRAPLTVRKVAAGTEFAIDMCEEGLWYDELVKNKFVRKQRGGDVELLEGPDDTTAALVKTLDEYQPDLFITSGHATERNWQIGFRYRNGYFKSAAGQMIAEDSQSQTFDVNSPNPKIYLPIGNCLMGHVDGPDAMALAWMNDVGVKQMLGYTVPTWFGYAGWGVLDYFVEQPGRYTFTEAFFANQQALVHCLETGVGNQRGLEFDRDVVAFYGDPKWEARMSPAPTAYAQSLTHAEGVYTLEITPKRGSESFKPINLNGSQRGWRPIVQWLPTRIKNVEIVTGSEWNPVITDDFILVPNPRETDPSADYRVVFKATPMVD